jgi:hypothetical protein
MIKALALFIHDCISPRPSPSRPFPVSDEELIIRADSFEEWLRHEIGSRKLSWMEVRDFIEKHSRIIAREAEFLEQVKLCPRAKELMKELAL